MNGKIAICITARNRIDVLMRCIIEHTKYLPKGARLIIVDDASDDPVIFADYRFEQNVGIPKAKNKCLELAEDWGADHIFLFDSDTWPLQQGWHVPYVQSIEPHLMYQFALPTKPKSDMQEVYRDNRIVAYNRTRGAMLYVEKIVLDTVGGFDTAYGLGFYEHPDYSNRIHNAGLTTHRAADVVGSGNLLYCLDQDNKVESSMPGSLRKRNMRDNYMLYKKSITSKAFKAYRNV